MQSTRIAKLGTYEYAADIYEVQMRRTRSDLYQEVKSACEGMEITGLYKLRKFELAAMVAEWKTATRQNEWDAEKARYANMCKLEKGAMTCLSPKGHDGLCTDIQGTRFKGKRVESLAEMNTRLGTPEVKATPFANLFNVAISGRTVGHVSYRADTGTWNAYQQSGDEDVWVGYGWTREECVDSLLATIANAHNL